MGWVLLGIMLLFLVLGFPMFVAMTIAPLVCMVLFFPTLDQVFVIQQLINGVSGFVYVSIPMFIFAADVMCAGHSANRLIDFAKIFVRHVRGGMGIATAVACTLFGAISGSTQATVVAIGRPMYGELLRDGYKEKDALALIISASGIAILIPPSTTMIMYGVVTGTSVSELFIAGIGPGLLLCFLMSAWCFYAYGNVQRMPRASAKEIWAGVKRVLPCLGLPVIILGGIYSGIFSPTEAAVAGTLYAIVLELVIYRSIKIRDLGKIALSTGMVSAAVFIIIAGGNAFSWVVSYARIPQAIISSVLGTDPSALKVLVAITVVFLVGGMLVDPFVIIVIAVPIFFPSACAAGIDPVHLGMLITVQVALGGITPPFGANIFTACAVFNKRYVEVIRGIAPYIILQAIATVLIILFPQISTFLLK